jgi:hypothetical protein
VFTLAVHLRKKPSPAVSTKLAPAGLLARYLGTIMEVRISAAFIGDLILDPLAVPHVRLKVLDSADHLQLESANCAVDVFVIWFSVSQLTQTTKEDGHMGKFKSKECGHGGSSQMVSPQTKPSK